jgi:cytochrome c556
MKKKNIKKFADAIAWYSREYGAMWVSYDKLRTEKAQLQADLDKLQEECCAEVTALKARIMELEQALGKKLERVPNAEGWYLMDADLIRLP